MFAKARWFGLLALVAVIATSAVAQKNEIAGGIGRTFISDETIKRGPIPIPNNVVSFGHGTTWEVNYARHLWHRGFLALDAEVPVVGNPDEDLSSGNGAIPSEYSSVFVTPAARIRFFAENAVQLWVSGGGGFGHWTMSNTLVYGGVNPGPKGKNSGVAQAGGGLDLRHWKHFGFRLAARDFYVPKLPLNVTTTSSHHHNIVVSGGVIFSF
ncbi:MAG TPA: hypothetical protein VMT53_15195 [Terriglobales bacterium]|nr:hypothetical protein [Terriglobales bacterium]